MYKFALIVIALTVGCSEAVAPQVDAADYEDTMSMFVDGGAEDIDAGTEVEDGGVEAGDAGTLEEDGGAEVDGGEVVDAAPDSGGAEDAGSPDSGAGESDAGSPDSGPVDPCSLCTDREVCVAGSCVFDSDPRRTWELRIHSVQSQIPALPYYRWDPIAPAGTDPESFAYGEADLRVSAQWFDGSGTFRNNPDPTTAMSPAVFGTVWYSTPWVAFTGTLSDMDGVTVSFEDLDWVSGGGGGSQTGRTALVDTILVDCVDTATTAQDAAHDGAQHISECVDRRYGTPARTIWSIAPAP